MTISTTATTRQSRPYSFQCNMDSTADKEERKREYNRLAQREFRRRRKEHLKNLEQMQKDQSTEQWEEIERLRYQNDELRRENEALRAQIYGSSSSSSHLMASASINVPSISADTRQYSLSPSLSGTSLSGIGSPTANMSSDMMPMAALSLSSSMIPPSMSAYADPVLSQQPYSMVYPSTIRYASSQSSPESSGYRGSRSTVGPSFQSMNEAAQAAIETPVPPGLRRVSGQQPTMVMAPYDRNKARTELLELFRPICSDPAVSSDSQRHLSALESLSASLPSSLKPSKSQLETPHYYGIDLVASPSLRERLMTVTTEVARKFVAELGIIGNGPEEKGQVIIWGEDPLNEMSWEVSPTMLSRWGWLLGSGWAQRTNFWRTQRGAPPVPEW